VCRLGGCTKITKEKKWSHLARSFGIDVRVKTSVPYGLKQICLKLVKPDERGAARQLVCAQEGKSSGENVKKEGDSSGEILQAAAEHSVPSTTGMPEGESSPFTSSLSTAEWLGAVSEQDHNDSQFASHCETGKLSLVSMDQVDFDSKQERPDPGDDHCLVQTHEGGRAEADAPVPWSSQHGGKKPSEERKINDPQIHQLPQSARGLSQKEGKQPKDEQHESNDSVIKPLLHPPQGLSIMSQERGEGIHGEIVADFDSSANLLEDISPVTAKTKTDTLGINTSSSPARFCHSNPKRKRPIFSGINHGLGNSMSTRFMGRPFLTNGVTDQGSALVHKTGGSKHDPGPTAADKAFLVGDKVVGIFVLRHEGLAGVPIGC
jgi:hypothetical protein